jgi:hypothetical protein
VLHEICHVVAAVRCRGQWILGHVLTSVCQIYKLPLELISESFGNWKGVDNLTAFRTHQNLSLEMLRALIHCSMCVCGGGSGSGSCSEAHSECCTYLTV